MSKQLSRNETYTHPKFHGIALNFVGYPRVWVPYTSYAIDDEGNEYEETTGEGEWESDESGNVLVTMVGDDYKHSVDPDDLTQIDEEDFCHSCGQIGCGHGGNASE